jgi:hypothetical protein
MRLLLAKNTKRLKFLDHKGAEANKIDATRNMVRKLSTKLRISVRVIAKVSKKINRVRDEELWPQINALVQGYALLFFHPEVFCQMFHFSSLFPSFLYTGSINPLSESNSISCSDNKIATYCIINTMA